MDACLFSQRFLVTHLGHLILTMTATLTTRSRHERGNSPREVVLEHCHRHFKKAATCDGVGAKLPGIGRQACEPKPPGWREGPSWQESWNSSRHHSGSCQRNHIVSGRPAQGARNLHITPDIPRTLYRQQSNQSAALKFFPGPSIALSTSFIDATLVLPVP